MPSPQPVDLAHLARYTGGDVDLNADVLSLFIRQCAEILTRLGESLEEGNAKGWRETAHSLKGGARGVGAFELADLATQAESVDPAHDLDLARGMLGRLKSSALATTLFIEAYLGR